MILRSARAGVTLVEVMISMGATMVILGALFLSSLSLQKTLHGSEVYAGSYSDQRRLIDYLGRDLRRAVGVSATDENGQRYQVAADPVTINERATLIVALPGYYQSDAPGDSRYDQPLAPVPSGASVDYGSASGPAPMVEVSYRKVFTGSEKSVCFVRQEAGTAEVVVRQAESLYAQVTIAADGRSGAIKAWFRAPYSGAGPLVTTFDEFMLRNTPLQRLP